MLKKAVLAFFNHDRPEVNSARSHNFNELGLVGIGDPSLDRTQGIEKRFFQHPAIVQGQRKRKVVPFSGEEVKLTRPFR